MIAGLLDHLWQSSIFAGGAGLLTLALRCNAAGLRFQLWFVASLKFLLPFAGLAAVGEGLSRLLSPDLARAVLAIQPAAQRFSAPAEEFVAHQPTQILELGGLLISVWILGCAAVLGLRLTRWLRLRALVQQADDLNVCAPIQVKASSWLQEPGLVGILKPVILMPQGLIARLSDAERDCILAHELGHLARRDNLMAAIHMMVETLFWFWPPVWLIGARLVTEREQACDQAVLSDGHDPEIYAGSILKVCRFCIPSPLACVAGASGADLMVRVRLIMAGERVRDLGASHKLLLAGFAIVALGLPLAGGFVASPLGVAVRRQVEAAKLHVTKDFVPAVVVARQILPVPRRTKRLAHPPRVKIAAIRFALPPLPAQIPLSPSPPSLDENSSVPPPLPRSPQANVIHPVQPSVSETLLALYPRGTGDPDAVTCRVPQQLPGSRLRGPQVCQTNRLWASLRARHQDIAPDGQTVMVLDGLVRHEARSSPCNVALKGTANFNWVSGSYCF